ncbi:hypothetical protein [Pseudonocardia abyssalis]|uniref:Uncharacterized protein n=1 Tax=Pseudonocardia abyssalis TaxID=2792008 RepID=A0ABS6UXX6_9PSEU|nr:hypothetical protein [Pseudonocardia abyssalis]MBW0119314.1 hypothetical protein [Pseudonocardia abyssalis]MBW0137082.1 hypothetical protein [Pseudonocardia abyssalis]
MSSDAARHVTFRGGGPGQEPVDGPLVEFFLSERDGGTLLRVVEGESVAGIDVEGNGKGWEPELAAAKQRAQEQ